MASLNTCANFSNGLKPGSSKLSVPLWYTTNQTHFMKRQSRSSLLRKHQFHETTWMINSTSSGREGPFDVNSLPFQQPNNIDVNIDNHETSMLFTSKTLWDIGHCLLKLPCTIWGLIQGDEKTIKQIEGEIKEVAEKVKDMAGKVDKVAKEVEKVAECVEEDAEKVETLVDKIEKKRQKFDKEVEDATSSLKDIQSLSKKSHKESKQEDNHTSDSSA